MEILITKSIDTSSLTKEILLSMPKEDLVQIVLQLNSQEPPREDISSKYHYVSWSEEKEAWMVQVEKDIVGYFNDEIKAAIIADGYLDAIENTDKPRNKTIINATA